MNEKNRKDNKHIFVVNGEPSFLELMRELLQGEHYNVTTTNFVPKTFAQIEALGPDLIVIDLAIGEAAGWELLEDLEEAAVTRDIPVIVTSTDPSFLDYARRNEKRYGADRYIAKPMNLEELRNTIEEVAGKA